MSKPGYPIWWDSTVTIYNKYTDTSTRVTSWYKTVVTDCYWHLTGSEITVGQTVLDGKSIICRIPKDSRYLDRSEWVKLTDTEKKDHFTIGHGDIIVLGECSFVIDEYTAGSRSTDLLSKYTEYEQCLEVNEFADNTGIGRNNEHYKVRGK